MAGFVNFAAFKQGWLICAPGRSLSAGHQMAFLNLPPHDKNAVAFFEESRTFSSNQPVLSIDLFIENNNLLENNQNKKTQIQLDSGFFTIIPCCYIIGL